MSKKPQNMRGKHDETYQRLKRLATDDNYEEFWEAIREYESERFRETVKIVDVTLLFGLVTYGCYYFFLK